MSFCCNANQTSNKLQVSSHYPIQAQTSLPFLVETVKLCMFAKPSTLLWITSLPNPDLQRCRSILTIGNISVFNHSTTQAITRLPSSWGIHKKVLSHFPHFPIAKMENAKGLHWLPVKNRVGSAQRRRTGEKSSQGQMFHLKLRWGTASYCMRGVKGVTVTFLGSGAAVWCVITCSPLHSGADHSEFPPRTQTLWLGLTSLSLCFPPSLSNSWAKLNQSYI